MPDERARAVDKARDFLTNLLRPDRTPDVPKKIRERARGVLRHFPWRLDMSEAAKKAPEIFGEIEHNRD
jgi:hypothetical protein